MIKNSSTDQYKKWNKENKILLFNATWHSINPLVKVAREIGVCLFFSVIFLLCIYGLNVYKGLNVGYMLTILGTISGILFITQSYWAIKHKILSPLGTKTFVGNHARDLIVIEIISFAIIIGFIKYWNYLIK